MAWNDDKSTGDTILSDDWDAMVAAIGSTSYGLKGTTQLGSGNTYLEVDSNNNVLYIYVAGTKVGLMNSNGDLKIKGSFYEGQTL